MIKASWKYSTELGQFYVSRITLFGFPIYRKVIE